MLEVFEIKLEIYFDKSVERKVKKVIEDYHPYDEANYFIHENNIESREVGSRKYLALKVYTF